MTDRVTSADWSPFNPWTQHPLGTVYADPFGGPPLVRVRKVCRDARGHDRLKGCGRQYEGWAFQDRAHGVPLSLRRSIVDEDGSVWGLCDDCIDKIESHRVSLVPEKVVERKSLRDMQAPEEIDR